MTIIRPATAADLPRLHPVVERAYRGDSARQGWTHEADMLSDARTDLDTLATLIEGNSRLLIALDGDTILGCVNVASRGNGLAYLGLLCVDPEIQARGIGKQLIAAAEATARDSFAADRIEMTVIDRRVELIAWYERHGYTRSGETRPFPVLVDPPLTMTVLVKPLFDQRQLP
ncbi:MULTISPECIES: GNAT family N-acetyltransferase [unclassified Sphingomonas]|uniref:GNAT family N-acetyltransferase n=1 Tax=unclassified Sphingomonas TaxID=196159 RepID=UPI002150FE67|nr:MULTISPECIES: GNAT family N-acetyltransferase [unclassified Sphingomonas]MCR5872352.1 GNAT family N-acetyltransferase [Sphingomonas sp. J344]UUX99354.1 GNAT family N-acetyltransferase [Sphingomonas sp. J315]